MRPPGVHCGHKTTIITASRNSIPSQCRIKIYFFILLLIPSRNPYSLSEKNGIVIMIAFISLSKLKLKQGELLRRKFLVYICFKLIHSSYFFDIPIRKVTTLKYRKWLIKRMTSTDRTFRNHWKNLSRPTQE